MTETLAERGVATTSCDDCFTFLLLRCSDYKRPLSEGDREKGTETERPGARGVVRV